jgi:hypothetical protein
MIFQGNTKIRAAFVLPPALRGPNKIAGVLASGKGILTCHVLGTLRTIDGESSGA